MIMVPSKIIYREKLPPSADYHQLFETTGWNQSYRANADELFRAISSSWYTLAAYDKDELVGFGRVVSDGVLYALICDLIVKPSCQGQGIGTRLLTHAEKWAHEHNRERLTLWVAATNERAIQVYRKAGFAISRTRSSWLLRLAFGVRHWHFMEKKLAATLPAVIDTP